MLGSVRLDLCGDPLLASAGFQAIAVAVHLQNVDVVGEPVEQRPGEPLCTEDPGPLVKWQDTVGELVGYAASAAKREMRVGASGRPANQAATRSRLRAAAVATCCRRVLARPR